MPVDQPLTEDPPFKHRFPWQMDLSNEEFMSWKTGKFQCRITSDDANNTPYYLIRFPPMNPGVDKWRFTICPYNSDEAKRDIEHNIARLYDISKLMQKLFPNKETHPIVHQHETALFLLKEADYVQYVQSLMLWIGVDESTSTLLMFEPTTPPTRPPPHEPTHCPTHVRQDLGCIRGAL